MQPSDTIQPVNGPKAQLAREVLDGLFEEAERHRMFGIIGVEVSFHNGVARKVRRRIDDTVEQS